LEKKDKNNFFESQDLKISENYDNIYKNYIIDFHSTPIKSKNSNINYPYSEQSIDFMNKEKFFNESDNDFKRNINYNNYVSDNTANSEKSKNTCLNLNEIFKNFEEPKQNLMASKVSNLNLQGSTNSINTFLNLNKMNIQLNKGSNPSCLENKNIDKLFISQKYLKSGLINKEINFQIEDNSIKYKIADNEAYIKKLSRKQKSIDFLIRENDSKIDINEDNSNFIDNKKIDASEIHLDQIINKNADDSNLNNHKEELSTIDFPNISSPYIIEKQKTFSEFKPDNSKAISKDDLKSEENNPNTVNFDSNLNIIYKAKEINKANSDKKFKNKGLRRSIEFKNKKKFNAFNSDIMMGKNNYNNNLNIQSNLRFHTEKETYHNNPKMNTIHSLGNYITLNLLEKNDRPNTLSPEKKNICMLDSEKKEKIKEKNSNFKGICIENQKIKNERKKSSKEKKFVKVKTSEKTPNSKNQNIITIDNNSENKKIETDLFSLKDQNNRFIQEKEKSNLLEISNAVNVEISGSDKQ